MVSSLNDESNRVDLKYDCDIEMESGYWNTSSSQLWVKLQRVFADDIAAEYTKMRLNQFNVDNIMKYLYEGQISKISPVNYNHDMYMKYLQYGAQFVYACHGNKYHHLKRWIRERILFCDTLFNYAPTTTGSSITLRCNRSGDVSLDIETYSPMYLQVKWRNGTVQKLKIERGKATHFTGYLATETDQEVLIYNAPHLKSIGDISYLNPNSIDIGNATKLNYLKCNCEALLKADVSNNPYLRYIDLTNCSKLGTAVGSNVLNVSGCDNLRELYIKGTALTSIQSNLEGGNITKIVFPKTVQSIDLRNMYILKELDIPEESNLNSLTLMNCPNIETLTGYNVDVSQISILQRLQTISLQNSLNMSIFKIKPINLINLAIRDMKSIQYIELYKEAGDSTTPVKLSTCTIDEIPNLVSLNINCDVNFVTTKSIDLSKSLGLKEIVMTGNISGLETIYIPTSVEKLVFTGSSCSIKNILVKTQDDQVTTFAMSRASVRPEGFEGIDLTGCTNIKEFDMIALTEVKNVMGLDIKINNNPNFNTRRTIDEYIRPEGSINLIDYVGIDMSNLFKGIDFNLLDVTMPSNLEDVTDATSMFRACIFSETINPDTIIAKIPNLQTATYMFAECGFTEDIRPTLVLDKLPQLIDASYMFANCTGLVNFNNIEIPDTINTTNMFQGIAVEEIGTLNMSQFPFTIVDKIESIGNMTLTQATSTENLFKDNRVLNSVGNISLPNVINASHMFDGCFKLTTVGEVSIPKALDLSYMYNGCIKLTSYNDINNYPEATNLTSMYANTKITTIGDLSLKDEVIATNIFDGVNLTTVGNVDTGSLLFSLSSVQTIGNFSIRNLVSADNLFKDNKILISIGDIELPSVTTATHMFDGCTSLQSIGEFTLPLVTDLKYAFANTNLPYVNISGNCINITDISYMYKNNTGITTIGDLNLKENLIVQGLLQNCINLESVGNVTLTGTDDSSYMFDGCVKLASIESLSIDDVVTANYMFARCNKLNLSALSAPKLVTAKHMFEECSLLKTSPLTAPLLEDGSYMFANCVGLTEAFDVHDVFENITDASYIFKGCTSITTIGDFTLSETILSTGMFEGTSISTVGNVISNTFPFDGKKIISVGDITLTCNETRELFKDNTTLVSVGNITLSNVTDASYMFDGCDHLATIGTITAPLLENASHMFRNCSLITNMVDFSNYPNLVNVDYMYSGCIALPKTIENLILSDTITSSTGLLDNVGITSVGTINIPTIAFDLSSIQSIDTLIVRNTVDAKGLFKDNTSLTSIGTVSLPNAENISGLFKGCSNITSITSVSAPRATIAYEANYGGVFEDCSSLTATPDITGLSNITVGDYMFKGCSGITSIDTGIFDNLNSAYKMFSGCASLTQLTDLDLSHVDNITDMFEGCEKITKIGNYTADTMVIPVDRLTSIGNLTLNEVVDASNMFKDNTKLKTIGIITMPNVIDTVSMFEGCTGLTSVGANCNIEEEAYPLVLPKIDNMSRMFYGCTGLTASIYTDNLTTATNVSYLYAECTAMKTITNLVFHNCTNSEGIINNINITTIGDIDLNLCDFTFKYCTSIGNITIRSIVDASRMFYGCNKLTTIGNVNLPIATDCNNMFNSCTNLVTMGELNIPLLEDGSYMFASCVKFSEVPDLSGFANLTNASYMFRNCSGLGPIIGDVILPNVQTVTGMFAGIAVTQVGNIDLAEMPFDIKALVSIGNIRLTLTNASYMFRGCTTLTTVGDIDFPNVTTANYLFGGCTSLTTVGSISMEKVVSANYMFNECSSLNCLINLSNFPELKDASYMFNGCTSFPSVMGDVILPKVENVKEMFTGITLTEIGNIDLPSFLFDSSKLTKIGNMKLRTVTSTAYLFTAGGSGNVLAENTKLISVGNIDLPMVTDASYMFNRCINLKSAGYIHAPKCNTFKSMFWNCTSLTDAYFPYSEVENDCSGIFNVCSALESVKFEFSEYKSTALQSTFSDSKLQQINILSFPLCKNLSYTFYNCLFLTDITFTDNILENLTTMEKMCMGCTNLTNVKLPENLPNCTNYIDTFRECTALEEIIIPNDSGTENVIARRMFMKCTALKRVVMYNMLEDGELTENESIVKLHFIKPRNISFMFFMCSSLTYIKHLEFDYTPYTFNSSSETEDNATNESYQNGLIVKAGNYAYGFMGSCGITDIDYFKYPYKYYECNDDTGWTQDQNYSKYKMYMIEGNIQNIKYYEAQYIQCKLNKVKTIGTMKVGSIESTENFFLNNTNLISIDYLECAYGVDGLYFTQFTGCTNLKYINKIKTDASRFGYYYAGSLDGNNSSILPLATFGNCTSLIKIPDLSECKINIMVGTFYNCTSLEDINMDIALGTNKKYSSYGQHFRYVFNGCNNIKHITKFKIQLYSYIGAYFQMNPSTITNTDITEITADNIEFSGTYGTLIAQCYNLIPSWNKIKRIEYLKGNFFRNTWELDNEKKYDSAVTLSTTFKCSGFFGAGSLKEIGTYEMTDSIAYDSCRFAQSTLTSIDKIILNNKITSVYYLFYNCSSITKMPIIEGGSPDGVDMSYAFARSSIIEFNKDDLKVKIKNAEGLFAYCTTIPEVELPDLSEVTSLMYAFEGCTGLTSLEFNNLDSVLSLKCMCKNCTSLYNIIFNDINLANATELSYTFDNCTSLINIELPNFSVLKFMNYTFRSCINLSNIVNFYFGATEYKYTFSCCYRLIEFTLGDMPNATTLNSMFINCTSLNKIIMPNNMPNVLDMQNMLQCTAITEFIFPTKCPKLTTMQGFMASNSNLISFTVTDDADLSSVTILRGLLSACINVETVDLGTTTINVTDVTCMLQYCNSLNSIKKIIIPKVICTDNMGIISSSVSSTRDITIQDMSIANFNYVVGISNFDINTRLIINNLTITGTDEQIAFALHSETNGIGRWHIKQIGTISFTNCTNLKGYFYACINLVSIEEFNAPYVTAQCYVGSNSSYYGTFELCSNLEYITNLNIPNCTKSTRMFRECKRLKNVGFDIPKNSIQINMIYYNCNELKHIEIPEEMPNLTDMSHAFYNCWNANTEEGLIVPKTSNNLNATEAYYSSSNTKSVIVKEFINDYTNYTLNGNTMFYNAKILGRCAPILPQNFYTSTSYSYKMLDCLYIDDLDLQGTVSYSNAIIEYGYLKNCRRISNYINSIYYNTSTSTSSISLAWFYKSQTLEEIGTLKLTNTQFTGSIAGLFSGCRNLKSVEYVEIPYATLGGISISGDSDYQFYKGVFSYCPKLTSIGTLKFNNLTDAKYMFYFCTNLSSLDNLFIPSANLISYLFAYTNFSKLDLTKYTFCNRITNTGSMFYGMSYLTSIKGLSQILNVGVIYTETFGNCGNVTIDDDGVSKNNLVLDFENVRLNNYAFNASTNFIQTNTKVYKLCNLNYVNNDSSNYYFYIRNATEVENLIIRGYHINVFVISPNLTYESIQNILNGLRGTDLTTDTTATSSMIFFSQRNYDMLTDDDKLIATNLGWTVATTTTT